MDKYDKEIEKRFNEMEVEGIIFSNKEKEELLDFLEQLAQLAYNAYINKISKNK